MDPGSTDIATPNASAADPSSTLIAQTAADANGDVGYWVWTAFQARQDGRAEDARTLLLETLSRFPAEADPRVELARLEEMERNWIEAERCWREFAVLRPAVWWAPARVALALREQGRMADAEAVLAEALERFPDEIRVFLGPHVANNLSDFESALKTRIAELAPEKFYRLEEEADMGAPNGTAAGAPAMVVAEAPAWSGIQPEEPSAVVPAPVEDDSWMRRVASLFGSRARH